MPRAGQAPIRRRGTLPHEEAETAERKSILQTVFRAQLVLRINVVAHETLEREALRRGETFDGDPHFALLQEHGVGLVVRLVPSSINSRECVVLAVDPISSAFLARGPRNGPLWREHGILYATIDSATVTGIRFAGDAAGHYDRPDLFRLTINRRSRRVTTYLDDTAQDPAAPTN